MRTAPIPDYGEHMPLQEFEKSVKAGAYIDYDGHGFYATATEVTDVPLNLSKIAEGKAENYTFVVWFNK